MKEIHESRLDSHPANEYTSILEMNPNTTILI